MIEGRSWIPEVPPAMRTELAEAVELLEYALHLRMHGERAPGGIETWREFDQRCEAFLRKRMGAAAP